MSAVAGVDPLLELLAECIVPVQRNGRFEGTGFWVTPNELLTCAHVAHGGKPLTVGPDALPAELASPLLASDDPAARFYPQPDVALLRVPVAPAGHPCVRLDDTFPAVGDVLQLTAYTIGENAPGRVERSGASLHMETLFEQDGVDLFKLREGQVIGGFSGGPLLHRRTGGVCALVDSSRNVKVNLGGFGVPVALFEQVAAGVLARNAAFHATDRRWADAVDAQRRVEDGRTGAGARPLRQEPVWSVPALRGDEVARPDLAEALVAAVLASDIDAVGVATGLVGAGGFGKTTLARMVAHDPRVRAKFANGVVWVTVGEDAAGLDLAHKLVSTARLFDPVAAEVTDPIAAGGVLGRALSGQRVLLVVDDVWTRGQVEPFLIAADEADGTQVMRLFTTRHPGVVPAGVARVVVNQMTDEESAALLTAGLDLSAGITETARRTCGSWPLLLALVHGAVADEVLRGVSAEQEMVRVLTGLRENGITVLDVDDADQRSLAVARTLDLSIDRLTAEDRSRFEELAVFSPGISVPGDVVARLWARTAGWMALRTHRLCQRLFARSLLVAYRREPDLVQLHDVVATYLQRRTMDRLPDLHRTLVDAHREHDTSWADLDHENGYLLSWLPAHLHAAGLNDELRRLLDDRHWLARKTTRLGLAGLLGDLMLTTGPDEDIPEIARRLREVLTAASVAAMASDMSPDLLAEMTKRGVWSIRQAVDAISRMTEDDRRGESLVRVFACADRPMPDETTEAAWQVALALPQQHQFHSVATLIPWLPDRRIGDAVDAVNAFAGRSRRWDILQAAAALVGRLPATTYHTFYPWRLLPDLAYEHKMLLDGLLAIRKNLPGAAKTVLRNLVTEVDNDFDRCQDLAVLIPFLPTTVVDEIFDVLRTSRGRYRSDALIALAEWAPSDQLVEVLDLARDTEWESTPPESRHQRPWVELMRAVGPRLTEQTRLAALEVTKALRGDRAALAIEELAAHLDVTAARTVLNEFGANDLRWFRTEDRQDGLVIVAALAQHVPDAAAVMRRHLIESGSVDSDLHVVLGPWELDEPSLENAAGLASFAPMLSDDTVRLLLHSLCRGFTWTAHDVEIATAGLRRLAPRVASDPALLRDTVALMTQFGDWEPRARAAILTVLAPYLATSDLTKVLQEVLGDRVEPVAFATLAALGRSLPEPQRAVIADRGVAAAGSIRGERHRVIAMSGLASILPPTSARLALDTIGANTRSVPFPPVVTALETVLPHLAVGDLPQALEVFLNTPMVGNDALRRLSRLFVDLDKQRTAMVRRLYGRSSSGSTSDPRTWWLWDIGPFLPEPLALEAWAFARTVTTAYHRRALLACIARWLPAEARADAVRETLGLLEAPPKHAAAQIKILAPLVAAAESDDLTAACRGLLNNLHSMDLFDPWPRFIDLLTNIPVPLIDLALEFGNRLLPMKRYELIRTLTPRMPASQRAEVINELDAEPSGGWGSEMVEHARALIALSYGATNEERVLIDLLERMRQRNWWSVYRTAFVELIPRLPHAAREEAATTALRQCFEGYRIEGRDDLIGILDSTEVSIAFGELPRIRDHHARATVLGTLMRRAGDLVETLPALADTDLLSHIPADCTQDEIFAIIEASAWWIDCNAGKPGTVAVAETVLDIIRRWS